jgi:hypothetical protein
MEIVELRSSAERNEALPILRELYPSLDEGRYWTLLAEMLDDVLEQVVAHGVWVPSGVVEEVLDPSWPPLSDGLGHLPGVLAPDVV